MRYVSKREMRKLNAGEAVWRYRDSIGLHPEWSGKRAIMTGEDGPGTNLYIEGVSFEVVEDDDPRCPKEYLIRFYSGWSVYDPVIMTVTKWFPSEDRAKSWAKRNRPYREAGFSTNLLA